MSARRTAPLLPSAPTAPVTGRWLSVLATLLLAGVWLAQTVTARELIVAGRLLKGVEVRSLRAAASRSISVGALEANLLALRDAARLDPVEVGVPVARGSQYLLLRRPDPAIAAYREALDLEPRPEIYLNLGRALLLAGRGAEAQEHFALATLLDPHLKNQVPSLPLE